MVVAQVPFRRVRAAVSTSRFQLARTNGPRMERIGRGAQIQIILSLHIRFSSPKKTACSRSGARTHDVEPESLRRGRRLRIVTCRAEPGSSGSVQLSGTLITLIVPSRPAADRRDRRIVVRACRARSASKS